MIVPTSTLVLSRLRSSSESGFGNLIDLYLETFPESERKPVSVLLRMLADEAYRFLLATEDERIVGFAIVRTLQAGTAALLEYMAIARARRGRGLGKAVFVAIARMVDAPPTALLQEVESDRVEHQDRRMRTRRKQFYRSLGAREIEGLQWIMPPQMAIEPPAMDMLVFGAATTSISKAQLQSWLVEIYIVIYGQEADDSRVERMLASLPEEVQLI